MAQVGNNENRFGGRYFVQDSNHMVETSKAPQGTQLDGVRQSEQSQSPGRQQGSGDEQISGQQGGERRRPAR